MLKRIKFWYWWHFKATVWEKELYYISQKQEMLDRLIRLSQNMQMKEFSQMFYPFEKMFEEDENNIKPLT